MVVGEADIIATLLTEREGKVSAIARGVRKGSKRFGALEPMHTLTTSYDDKGTELVTLKEALITRPRTNLLTRLDAIESAGTLLRWARHMFPPKTPEPDAFATLIATLDALDAGGTDPHAELAVAGLKLLADVGWGLELERCVRCGAPCPEDASAQLDTEKGGIVCQKCGGARTLLRAPIRRAAIAAQERNLEAVTPHARALVELVEAAMAAHAGFVE